MKKTEVIIAQSSTVYDNMLAQMDKDTRTIVELNKKIGELETILLKGSIQYMGALNKIRTLENENRKKDVGLLRLKEIAFMHCEMFEQIFESDEGSFLYEKMKEYLDVAELMKSQYGRESRYINRVKARMNKMPF